MKKSEPYRAIDRYGILNPYGDVWSPDTFSTIALAERHVREFWRGVSNPPNFAKFKIVRVRVTVSAYQQSE